MDRQPKSDINETPVTIWVDYDCGHGEVVHLIAEDLEMENFQRQPDGTYRSCSHPERCRECQIQYDEEKWGYLRHEEPLDDQTLDSDPYDREGAAP